MNKIIKGLDKLGLMQAAKKVGCHESQAESLWDILLINNPEKRKFNFFHTICFLGAVVVLVALGGVLVEGEALFGKGGFFAISLVYAALFMGLGTYLCKIKKKKTIGGISFFLFLTMVSIVLYAFQKMMGWWPSQFIGSYKGIVEMIHGGRFVVEVGTLICALITLYFVRFPSLSIIVYMILGIATYDILPYFFPKAFLSRLIDYALLGSVGLSIIIAGIIFEKKNKKDYAFWAFLFGVPFFWLGMSFISFISFQNEWASFLLFVSSIILIILGPLLKRKIFVVFGIIGIIEYLYHLYDTYFDTSVVFPFVLSFVGIGVIAVAVLWKYKKDKLIALTSRLLSNSK